MTDGTAVVAYKLYLTDAMMLNGLCNHWLTCSSHSLTVCLPACAAGFCQSHFLAAWVRFPPSAWSSKQHWTLCTTHYQWAGNRAAEDPSEGRKDRHPLWPWALVARTRTSTVPVEEAKPRSWPYQSEGGTALFTRHAVTTGWVHHVRAVQCCPLGAGTVLLTV